MKRLFLTCLLATGLIATQAQTSIAVGSKAPIIDQSMKDVSGKMISVKDAMKQNGVLVMFSCNTCPYVIKNQSRTKEIAAFAKANNIGIILLNSNEAQRGGDDSFAAMQQYAKKEGYDFPYVVDANHQQADAYGATRTPELFLLDAQGTVVYKGAIDDSPADVAKVNRIHAQEAIKELVGGKSVSIKESRSVGCTIKRMQ
jgi:peroxiredoxin